jgi:putative two-component system response regulator
MPHDEALAYIVGQAGRHFDPTVVAAMQAQERAFIRTATEFSD